MKKLLVIVALTLGLSISAFGLFGLGCGCGCVSDDVVMMDNSYGEVVEVGTEDSMFRTEIDTYVEGTDPGNIAMDVSRNDRLLLLQY